MNHKGVIGYVPAWKRYNITCVNCGETLTSDYNGMYFQEYQTGLELDWKGDCVPGEVLGVKASENVTSGDYFGGVS